MGAPQPRDGQVGRRLGDPEWVESESDPVTLVLEIDEDHWYTLTELAVRGQGSS